MGDPKNVCIGSDMFKERYVVPSDPASPCTEAVVQGLSGALPTIRISDIDGACCLRKLGAVADRVYAEKLSKNNCVQLLGEKVPNAGPICKDIVYELEHDADDPRFLTWSWLKHQMIKMSGTTIEQAPSAVLFAIAFVLLGKWFGGGGHGGGIKGGNKGKTGASNDDDAGSSQRVATEIGWAAAIGAGAAALFTRLAPKLIKISPAAALLPIGPEFIESFGTSVDCDLLKRDVPKCKEWNSLKKEYERMNNTI